MGRADAGGVKLTWQASSPAWPLPSPSLGSELRSTFGSTGDNAPVMQYLRASLQPLQSAEIPRILVRAALGQKTIGRPLLRFFVA